jgi:response regulator RpfG family c-di-GMP phosphodiesterase
MHGHFLASLAMNNIVRDWLRRPARAIAEAIGGSEKLPQAEEDQLEPESGPPSVRVLCVDDNPQVLRLLKRQLGTAYDLSVAQTAHDALALMAEGRPFDVLVSDLRMPDVHGLAFLKQARELYPATERIILTGLPDPMAMSEGSSAASAEQLIVKPWTKSELFDAVEKAVRRRRETSAAG